MKQLTERTEYKSNNSRRTGLRRPRDKAVNVMIYNVTCLKRIPSSIGRFVNVLRHEAVIVRPTGADAWRLIVFPPRVGFMAPDCGHSTMMTITVPYVPRT